MRALCLFCRITIGMPNHILRRLAVCMTSTIFIVGGCTDPIVVMDTENLDQGPYIQNSDSDGVPVDRPTLQMGEVERPFGPRPTVQTCQLPPPPPVGTLRLTPATSHNFQRPLWYGEPPLLAPWSFIAEQGGSIWAYREDRPELSPEVFFDITVSRRGNEEGLLGLAFHPQLGSSPYLFTYSSSSGCSAPNVARCSILSRPNACSSWKSIRRGFLRRRSVSSWS